MHTMLRWSPGLNAHHRQGATQSVTWPSSNRVYRSVNILPHLPTKNSEALCVPLSQSVENCPVRPAPTTAPSGPARTVDTCWPLPRIDYTNHQCVAEVGVALEPRLKLFGVDLLATAIDRHQTTAQHGDRPRQPRPLPQLPIMN